MNWLRSCPRRSIGAGQRPRSFHRCRSGSEVVRVFGCQFGCQAARRGAQGSRCRV